jgi:hypothetical protein
VKSKVGYLFTESSPLLQTLLQISPDQVTMGNGKVNCF